MIGIFKKVMLEEKLHHAMKKVPDIETLTKRRDKALERALSHGEFGRAAHAEGKLREGLRRLDASGALELKAAINNLTPMMP